MGDECVAVDDGFHLQVDNFRVVGECPGVAVLEVEEAGYLAVGLVAQVVWDVLLGEVGHFLAVVGVGVVVGSDGGAGEGEEICGADYGEYEA